MEEITSRENIRKWSADINEFQYSRSEQCNTFPMKIRKANEVQVFTITGTNSLNNIFHIEKRTDVEKNSRLQKTNENENVLKEGEFPGKRRISEESKFHRNTISSPTFDAVMYNGIDSSVITKSVTYNPEIKSLPVIEDNKRSKLEYHYERDLSVLSLNAGITRESYLIRNSSPEQATNSSENDTTVVSLHPQRPCRNTSSRRSTHRRSETPTTQIQITPLNNINLSSHVEEALGLFTQFKSYQPTIGSALFSILMTIVFVGILWIVVFTIFGPKGHAIAGIFLSIFILGFILNTCFLKFYFRLRLLFGVEQLREQTIRAQALTNLQQQREEEIRQQRATEPPPSYSSIIEAPPPYSIAKTMKSTSVQDSSSIDESKRQICCKNCETKESTTPSLCTECEANVLISEKCLV